MTKKWKACFFDPSRIELWRLTPRHNIVHIHNSMLWNWQLSTEYSPHSNWMWRIFYIIILVPCNTVMDLNNVMESSMYYSSLWPMPPVSFWHCRYYCTQFWGLWGCLQRMEQLCGNHWVDEGLITKFHGDLWIGVVTFWEGNHLSRLSKISRNWHILTGITLMTRWIVELGLNFNYNRCNGKKTQHNVWQGLLECAMIVGAKARKEAVSTFNYKEVIDNLTRFQGTTFFTFNEIYKSFGMLSLPMLV